MRGRLAKRRVAPGRLPRGVRPAVVSTIAYCTTDEANVKQTQAVSGGPTLSVVVCVGAPSLVVNTTATCSTGERNVRLAKAVPGIPI